MQPTILDKSNYLKGLLIVIGRDKKITEKERKTLLRLSEVMGFSKDFCDDAMNELFENEFIIEEPPIFSNIVIAKAFYIDCLRMASVDREIHLQELNWIKYAGEKNKLSEEWRINEFDRATHTHPSDETEFEICKLLEQNK